MIAGSTVFVFRRRDPHATALSRPGYPVSGGVYPGFAALLYYTFTGNLKARRRMPSHSWRAFRCSTSLPAPGSYTEVTGHHRILPNYRWLLKDTRKGHVYHCNLPLR